METEQGSLFDKRPYKGQLPPSYSITPPTADQTVTATLPAYKAYLGSGGYSKYTPDDFTADIKQLGQFLGSKALQELQTVDLQQWIAELKQLMPAKTVSRKVAALNNYFRWLVGEHVLARNPAGPIQTPRVTSPLPTLLYDNECERLLATASGDPRIYLLVLLVLETGLKKAELLDLRVTDFDFSNRYQPELWVKHTGKQVFKDRRLKLLPQLIPVFEDYVRQYGATDLLFPYTPRLIEQLLNAAARQAGIHKRVTVGILRDLFVVRSVKRGMKLDEVFEKIGLAKKSYEDARKKYRRLTSEAL